MKSSLAPKAFPSELSADECLEETEEFDEVLKLFAKAIAEEWKREKDEILNQEPNQ